MLPVAILAGGLASRLRPLTDEVPKALLEVAGRPFVFHQLELLERQGIRRVVLCVGHLGERIHAAVGDGRDWGLAVEYSYDGPELLGTGGALRQALPLLGEEFFVMYGDSYAECSLAQVESAYRAAGRPALMTVLRNDNRWDRSNARVVQGRLIEYDKHAPRTDMHHIDFGVSVLSRAVFETRPSSRIFDLAELYRELSLGGRVAALEVFRRFHEIGSFDGLRAADDHFCGRSSAG